MTDRHSASGVGHPALLPSAVLWRHRRGQSSGSGRCVLPATRLTAVTPAPSCTQLTHPCVTGEQLLGAHVLLKLLETLQSLRCRGAVPADVNCSDPLTAIKAEVCAKVAPIILPRLFASVGCGARDAVASDGPMPPGGRRWLPPGGCLALELPARSPPQLLLGAVFTSPLTLQRLCPSEGRSAKMRPSATNSHMTESPPPLSESASQTPLLRQSPRRLQGAEGLIGFLMNRAALTERNVPICECSRWEPPPPDNCSLQVLSAASLSSSAFEVLPSDIASRLQARPG